MLHLEHYLPHTLTARVWEVNNKHPLADDAGEGTSISPFETIGAAARAAQPGDVVLVRGGLYRERVAPARGGTLDAPIEYRAAPGEVVCVSGSQPFEGNWQPMGGDIWRAALPAELFAPCDGFNPFATPTARMAGKTLGQVWADDALLLEAGDDDELARTPGSWRAEAGGTALLVHFPTSWGASRAPQTWRIELTLRPFLFAPFERGLGHIIVRGFRFERCANQFPSGFWNENGHHQAGALSTRAGHGWTIEGNTIRFANAIGLDCGAQGGDIHTLETCQNAGWHLIRGNTVSDNGACGIAGAWHTGTRIIGNTLERNNARGWTAPETAGIKVHGFLDGEISGNIVRDNDCAGIWLDNVWYGSKVSENVCLGNQGAGIFVEMGDGPCLVANNVCGHTRGGEGIYLHDASGVTIAHNLLFSNAHWGVYCRTVSEREALNFKGEKGRVSSSRNRVLNNVFVDNYRGALCLPLPNDRDSDNQSDWNLFLGGTQWQWEGLSPNLFGLSLNDGRLSPQAASEFLGREVVAPPLLPLDEWQSATGNDLNSLAFQSGAQNVENGAVEKGGAHLALRANRVDFREGEVLKRLQCPPVEGLNTGLDSVTPGPFQNIKPGHNQLVLTPLG